MIKPFQILLTVFALSSVARAGERYEFYNGVRSLGMGGASVAVVNDETALISNPAALGKLRNYFVTVADPEISLGADTQRMIDIDVTKFLSPQDVLDQTKLFPGRRFHERAQIFPSFVVTNFGLGVFGKYETNGYYDSTAGEFQYDYTNDFAVVFGFNFRMFDGRVKLGLNARAVNRVEAHRDDIPVASTGLDFETLMPDGSTLAKEGFGVATDVGLILTAPWQFLPTLAVVYRDAGTTSYTMNSGMFNTTTYRPDRTPATLDAAIAFFPITGRGSRMAFTAELEDVMDAKEPAEDEAADEMGRRMHYGIEFNFGDAFFIRGGMNQGYWTAGLELAMGNTQLQLATYGEEVGDVVPAASTATYVEIEDRRYVAKFAYRF